MPATSPSPTRPAPAGSISSPPRSAASRPPAPASPPPRPASCPASSIPPAIPRFKPPRPPTITASSALRSPPPGRPPAAPITPSSTSIPPPAWLPGTPAFAGISWAVKNNFEAKNAARLLIDGNVFENNWVGVFQPQDGFAVAFTVAAGGSNTPWVVVKDVTFTHNIVQHSSAGIQFRGNDVNYPAQTLQRILIQDNLFIDIGAFPLIYNAGRLFQISDGGADYTFDHNTAFHIEDPLYAQTHAQGY